MDQGLSLPDETREDLARLSAIIAIQNDISSAIQPYALNELLAHAEQLTRANGAAIHLRDGAEMLVHSATGTAHVLAGARTAIDDSPAGLAIQSGTTVWSDDAGAGGTAGAGPLEQAGARSAIAVPLYLDGSPVGACSVFATEPRAFRARDVHTMQMMAGLAGSALLRSAALRHESPDQRQSMLELVQYEALHDSLTDLPREALLFDRLVHAIQLAKREETPLAVITLDPDRLAGLRARGDLGVADRTLREVVRRVRGALRASDTVARLEGDAIAILLPGANAIGALGTTKKIQRSVSQEFALDGETVELSVSAGIAMFPEHGGDAVELLSRAREALEHARRSAEPLRIYTAP